MTEQSVMHRQYQGPERVEARIDDLELYGGRYMATPKRTEYEDIYGEQGVG